MKSTSFAVNKVKNLNVNFCFVLNWTLPLFCTGARLSQHVRIQDISFWVNVEGVILIGICPIKQCFVVISVLITQTLQCVWNKGIIQVSDRFGIWKCDVYIINYCMEMTIQHCKFQLVTGLFDDSAEISWYIPNINWKYRRYISYRISEMV